MTIFATTRAAMLAGSATLVLAMSAATSGQAATVAALQDGNTIARIDTDKRLVTGSVQLDGGVTLVGFDVRPSDGRLYGVTAGGAIVIVDTVTGKWVKKSQIDQQIPTGFSCAVKFDPVSGRLRIIASNGLSYRINVDDGKAVADGEVKYGENDHHTGAQPRVMAAAYTNSFAGTRETALYDIDASSGTLVKQAMPDDGNLSTVGSLGVKIEGTAAFDIVSDGKGGNAALLVTGGRLYEVDLTTGAAKSVGPISGLSGQTFDIAVLPAK